MSADFLRALQGQPLPDGCPDCDADTTLAQHTPGVYVMEIHHDDTCPAYQARRARGTAS